MNVRLFGNLERAALLFVLAAQLTSQAGASLVSVPATSDLWLAGMPDGSRASYYGIPDRYDIAPFQSPVLLPIIIGAGSAYSLYATGSVHHGPSHPFFGPDGDPETVISHIAGAENGIANLVAPIDALIGVFLGPDQPDLTIAPTSIDFTLNASRDYTTISPELKQPFFIGDGLTAFGVKQQIVAPVGATRWYAGTMDGFGWFDNEGAFALETVPEPTTIALLLVGSLGTAAFARRKQKGPGSIMKPENGLRRRDSGCPEPPPQTRTCSIPASGSSVVLAFARARGFTQTPVRIASSATRWQP